MPRQALAREVTATNSIPTKGSRVCIYSQLVGDEEAVLAVDEGAARLQ